MRLLIVLLLSCGVSLAQESKTHLVKLNGQTFTLPVGFSIEVAAKAPFTLRPVAAAFDNKGRLYVTESSGSNEQAKIQLEKKPHSVLRLEDTDGDGIFDKKSFFADKMMFPQGVMWLDGSLYVGAPPHIWKLTDTNDDGVADSREIWFDGGTLTNCLNDLHGPYPGPDGYIYWTKGAFAKQTHTLGNGKKFESRASHIFRMKPDRTGLDVVMTGGMDNPVDVVFTPKGDIIFSTTFFQHPADGKRDGLIHAIYGGIYGKDHDVIHDQVHKWTSPNTMLVMTHLGPAAPCGLHRYTSNQFGQDYQDNIFCAQFNLRTVSRHVLVPQGSTYRTEDHPFVVSDSLDFHPTDVIEDRDGSLLIVDTGGWYKLCCPTSAIVKDDVHGAIYRVRKVGSHKNVDMPAAPPLPELYSIALNRDDKGLSVVQRGLQSDDPYTRRLAAHAAGRIGKPEVIPWILEAQKLKNDMVLEHALTYALIEIKQPSELLRLWQDQHPAVKRARLVALGQLLTTEKLPASEVMQAIRSPNRELREAAEWIVALHPSLSQELFDEFEARLKAMTQADPVLLADLTRACRYPPIQGFVANAFRKHKSDATRDLLLKVMAASEINFLPIVWVEPLRMSLASDRPEMVRLALNVLRKDPSKVPARLITSLQHVGNSRTLPREMSLTALSLLPQGLNQFFDADLRALLDSIKQTDDASLRSLSIEVVSKAKLSTNQLVFLTGIVSEASPLELMKLLKAFESNPAHERVSFTLFQALSLPKVRGRLQVEQLQVLFKTYADYKTEIANLQTLLDQDRAADRAKVEALLTKMQGGDVRRGQVVFYSQKAACSSCHKIGYVGGLVGPDLTRIGSIRSDRDLLEAIVLPSASFVRSYEPFKLTTQDGRVFNGILKSENSSEVVLAVNATETIRIPRNNVESLTPSTVSVMPSGLDQQLTVQELADLLAFLRSRK